MSKNILRDTMQLLDLYGHRSVQLAMRKLSDLTRFKRELEEIDEVLRILESNKTLQIPHILKRRKHWLEQKLNHLHLRLEREERSQ